MSIDGKIPPSIADAVQLARVRMDEMFRRIGASLPSDVQRELSAGVEAILVDVLNRQPPNHSRSEEARDFCARLVVSGDVALTIEVSKEQIRLFSRSSYPIPPEAKRSLLVDLVKPTNRTR